MIETKRRLEEVLPYWKAIGFVPYCLFELETKRLKLNEIDASVVMHSRNFSYEIPDPKTGKREGWRYAGNGKESVGDSVRKVLDYCIGNLDTNLVDLLAKTISPSDFDKAKSLLLKNLKERNYRLRVTSFGTEYYSPRF